MKLIAIFLFAACLQVSAKGYSQKITLSQKNVSLKKVFKEIESQSSYHFFYKDKLIRDAGNVSVNVSGASVEEALSESLKGLPLTFSVLGEIIVIKAKKPATIAIPAAITLSVSPENIVNGTVNDAKENGLAGVSVIVKGTKKGTSTGTDGTFSINADVGDVLEFSIVGFKKKSVTIGNNNNISVVMEIEAAIGNEVVVVGYGTQKKENVTGAVGVIQSSSLSDRPTSSPANLLQGLSPGLTVTTQGSYPGASANIKIRESSTWQGGGNPLYVIDGFVRDATSFASINPTDIDNISILKDAASAAIYGIRGGNGVILVTTKHGVADKTAISYNASYTWNIREISPRIMNAFEAYTFANNAYSQKNIPSTDPSFYTPDELDYFKTHSYNWVDDTWRNPWNTSHNLSVSGGSKIARYYISGGYLRQEGATSNSFDKYNFMAKLDGQITDRLAII